MVTSSVVVGCVTVWSLVHCVKTQSGPEGGQLTHLLTQGGVCAHAPTRTYTCFDSFSDAFFHWLRSLLCCVEACRHPQNSRTCNTMIIRHSESAG